MTASATADSTSAGSTDSADLATPGESLVSVSVPAAVPLSASGSSDSGHVVGQPTPAGVRSGRAQIDDLDARILALVTERISTAADIQAARIAEGGRRLDLKRETEIIARYRQALGRPGVTVAMAVLELCRGRV
ncbi:chorismate mutase [Catenulispora rubra]|uniref:chorismate mutase n=1 Tax=Catenulispora rubra TaxID=280293 RepID=UPI0018923F9B|nr:chorismate mutase [Catenulispora rubra]